MSVKLDDTVCRVCLSSSGNISIFDGCGKDDQFRYCTSLEASQDDGLPSKLCKKCNDHLKVAYDFRFQAIYAEKYFRKTIFLPSLKKEDEGYATVIDGRNELDENMTEIDILLANHTDATEEPDNDNDDMDNGLFYDDDECSNDQKHVEVIGMETFEREQREQREQKIKIELANVPAPVVSSAPYVSPVSVTNVQPESSESTLNNKSFLEPPQPNMSEMQNFTSSDTYSVQSMQRLSLDPQEGRSLQLEILPVLKNDPSTYDYNTPASLGVSYEPYNAPPQMSYSTQMQYESPQVAQNPSLPLQNTVSQSTGSYEYAYQPQYPPYSAQISEVRSEQQEINPVQQPQQPLPTVTAPPNENEMKSITKTENPDSAVAKAKKSKRDGSGRKDKIECNICGSIFTHLNSLKTHLLKHSGEKPFHCEFCGKAFARKTVLNIHRRLHTGEKPYKCSLCTSAYVTKEALTRHLQKDHEQEVGANFRKDKVSYICSICNKSRCSKYSLASHMRIHNTDAKARRKVIRKKKEKGDGSSPSSAPLKYSCKVCQKGFPNKWELSTHAESHDMNKTFECDICQRTFEKKFQLLYHLQTHDGGEELVKAKVQPSNEKQPSKTHVEDEKNGDVPEMKRKRRRKSKMEVERDNSDEDVADEKVEDDENEKEFKVPSGRATLKRAARAQRENLKILRASNKIECHICETVFTHPTSLKTHMLVHSGERPFKCDHCDKAFARKTVLNIHRRLHTGEKPYKCPLCDNACVTKDALMRHMSKDHDDDRESDRIKFTCGICHKAMGTKYSLQAHMKLHEQNSTPDAAMKYSCNTCTETFDTKSDYTNHMQVHDSHRNFQCDICQETFEKKFKLLFHLQTHKIEDLPCKKCGETFTIRENLIQHIKLQHMDPRNMDFQCPHCNIGQYDTRDLKLHMQTAHEVTMGGLNSCDLCGETYSTAAEYYKHMRERHDAISKTCNECDKYFDSRKAFDKHILTHYM